MHTGLEYVDTIYNTVTQLPKTNIDASFGFCETCDTHAELGNGLCVDCWDYVIDHTNWNSKVWPDKDEFDKIPV